MNVLNNNGWVSRFLSDKDLPTEQNDILQRIISRYYDYDNRHFNFTALERSKHWEELLIISNALKSFDPMQLNSYEDQLSFWLNTFNLLMIQGITKSSLEQPLIENTKFFSETAYQVGEEFFSLDDIEHGILRANGTKFGSIGRYFKKGDPRILWIVHKLDPRIHFCMYSACKSSPHIAAFTPKETMQQLSELTKVEITEKVKITNNKISVPKTFKWYKNDFGNKDQLLKFIADHSDDIVKLKIQSNLQDIDIKYNDFDWNLKKAFN